MIAIRNVFGTRYADVTTATDGEYTFKLPSDCDPRSPVAVSLACAKERARLIEQIAELQRWSRLLESVRS